MCTKAALEDLCLKLGKCNLESVTSCNKLSAISAFLFLTLYLKTKTRNPRKVLYNFPYSSSEHEISAGKTEEQT